MPLLNQKGSVQVIVSSLVILILVGAGGFLLGNKYSLEPEETVSLKHTSEKTDDQKTQLTEQKNQSLDGNSEKLIQNTALDLQNLPLGNNKVSNTPKKGFIYSCRSQFNGGGAFQAGPWINVTANTWDLTKKITVDGANAWSNTQWKVQSNTNTRMLSGNGLPSHKTGTYPIKSSDDAYQYDRNPNSIKEQSLTYNLPLNPVLLETPECVSGEVGIMLSGTPLFNGFDAAGRDAVAYEIQDECGGHPQVSGLYHYHGVSKCLKDEAKEKEHSSLVGYAFDGFGIFGTKGEGGTELSTNLLDECHGHTHQINWDNNKKEMYHYHLTYDFPYSVGCFRGKKAVSNNGGGEQMKREAPLGLPNTRLLMQPAQKGPPPPR